MRTSLLLSSAGMEIALAGAMKVVVYGCSVDIHELLQILLYLNIFWHTSGNPFNIRMYTSVFYGRVGKYNKIS